MTFRGTMDFPWKPWILLGKPWIFREDYWFFQEDHGFCQGNHSFFRKTHGSSQENHGGSKKPIGSRDVSKNHGFPKKPWGRLSRLDESRLGDRVFDFSNPQCGPEKIRPSATGSPEGFYLDDLPSSRHSDTVGMTALWSSIRQSDRGERSAWRLTAVWEVR